MDLASLRRARLTGQVSRDVYWHLMRERSQDLNQFSHLLDGSYVSAIRIVKDEIQIELVNGLLLTWDSRELREPPSLLVFEGEYEPAETQVLLWLARRARSLIDVGANVGYFSLLLAHTLPELTVLSIEPAELTHQRLLRNIEINGLEDRVISVRSAVGAVAGIVDLVSPKETGNVGASLTTLHPDEINDLEIVPIDTLDHIAAGYHSLSRDLLLKIDVEGAEALVLRGASQTLRCCFAVQMELSRKWLAMFGATGTEIIQRLDAEGFRCFAIAMNPTGKVDLREIQQITDETPEVNFIFIHSEMAVTASGFPSGWL